MPINAFSGEVGSGKTYGVISHVILPALANGRFVITNIDGLDIEAIYEYVAKEYYKGQIICIGHLRHCDREAPEQVGFFPGADSLDKQCVVPEPDRSTVNGGDLVVIDEATRYWVQGQRVSSADQFFFREHRHFSNEMGHTCDLVVLDPDISMFPKALKGKIEMSSLTHKPKEIGLQRYVVRTFRGVKLTGKPVSSSGPHKFDPEVVKLYRSYSGKGAKEQAIDSRQSLLPQLVRKLGFLVLAAACSIGAVVYLVMQKVDAIKSAEGAATPVTAVAGAAVSPNPFGAPGGVVVPPVGLPAQVRKPSPVSQSVRVAGDVMLNGERWVLLEDGGRVRLENPDAFVGRGSLIVGNLDGDRVTTWSGVAPGGAPGTGSEVK